MKKNKERTTRRAFLMLMAFAMMLVTFSFYVMSKNEGSGKVEAAESRKVDSSYTGLAKNSSGWWYYNNGHIDKTFTGLCKYNGYWWYINRGQLDRTYTGLCKYNGHWWYINKGRLDRKFTGLCKYNGYWWYIRKGEIDRTYTGLCNYNGHWWYVSKGQLNRKYKGLCKYNGYLWYVKKGQIDRSYTGLCKYNGSWWYCNKGRGKYVVKDARKIYKAEYLNVLKNNKDRINNYTWQFRRTGDKPTPVALYDIDGNGIPELIFLSANLYGQSTPSGMPDGAEIQLSIYTCNDEGAIKLYDDKLIMIAANYSQRVCVIGSEKDKSIYTYIYHIDSASWEIYKYLKMSNGGITVEDELRRTISMEDNNRVPDCSFNGEKISKSDFDNKEKLIYKNNDILIYNDNYTQYRTPEKNNALSYEEALSELKN